MSEAPGAHGLLLFLALSLLDGPASGGWLLLGNWLAPAEQPAGGFSSCWGPEGAGYPAACSGARELGDDPVVPGFPDYSRGALPERPVLFMAEVVCGYHNFPFFLGNVGNVSI